MTERSDIASEARLLGRLRQRLAFVRLLLLAERLWQASWPVWLLVGAWVALALLGFVEALPAVGALTLLLAFIAAALVILRTRLRGVAWPGERDARRRLEHDSGAAHRPLDAVFDEAATSSGGTALWRRHRARMARVADTLHITPPRLSLVAQDPRALRSLVLILLLLGLMVAGRDAGRRLVNSLLPNFDERTGTTTLDAWLTPPDYTGRSPILLGGEATEGAGPLVVPQGTTLVARLHGGGRVPAFRLGEQELDFHEIAGGSFELTTVIAASGQLEIRQGRQLVLAHEIEMTPDRPPLIGFAGPPGASRRQVLRLDYTMDDDYGVSEAALEVTPLEVEGEPLLIPLRGARTAGEPVTATAWEDLTPHPYAGSRVSAVLSGHDALGQEARSEPLEFVLPERHFSHPVAKKLVAIRKDLIRNPLRARVLAHEIDAIAAASADYDHDLTVYTVLRSAFWRLANDVRRRAAREVGEMLWQTALRLEDGQVSLASRDLREAMEAFSDALDRGGEGIDGAAAELERMMQDFLSQMARQQGETAPRQPPGEGGDVQVIGADMLQDMIRQMRDLAAAGETAAAMQMLAQLREIMENATTGTMSAEDYERMMATGQAARDLDKLRGGQRELLDQTSRQTLLNRLLERSGRPNQAFGDLEQRQQSLGGALEALRKALGESGVPAPEPLEDAAGAMAGAAKSLGAQSGPGAIRDQAEALRALDEAAEALGEMMRQAMSEAPAGNGLDPLGRPRPGLSTRDYKLPDGSGLRAAERIIEELRRRVADPDLSEDERAYLRRLLRRF